MEGIAVLAFLGLFAWNASAQQETFHVVPDSSQIQITLNTTHEVVHGTFPVQAGSVVFDHRSSNMSGNIIVRALGATGNNGRDKGMNNDVLQMQWHTTISFSPKSYSGQMAASGDSNIQVSGTFNLLDVAHDITVPMSVHIGDGATTAKAHFLIPYVQWGLKDPSFLFWKAEKNVVVDMKLVGQVSTH